MLLLICDGGSQEYTIFTKKRKRMEVVVSVCAILMYMRYVRASERASRPHNDDVVRLGPIPLSRTDILRAGNDSRDMIYVLSFGVYLCVLIESAWRNEGANNSLVFHAV